jgi:hypothetical protein
MLHAFFGCSYLIFGYTCCRTKSKREMVFTNIRSPLSLHCLPQDYTDSSPRREGLGACRAEVTQRYLGCTPETFDCSVRLKQATDGRQTRAAPRESIVFLTDTVNTVTIFSTLDYTRCYFRPPLDLTSRPLYSRQRHVRRGCAQPSAIHYCIVTYRPYSACDRIPRIFC